jgi:hypothetical protein
MLRSPGGFGGGIGCDRSVGGLSFARIALKLLTRGEQQLGDDRLVVIGEIEGHSEAARSNIPGSA